MREKYRPGRRALSVFLSAALAVTMMPAMFAGSGPAFAAEKNGGTEPSTLDELAASMVSGDAAFDFADGEEMTAQEAYPQSFDLRAADLGDGVQNYVTPVKFQNPFGTCWGFAAIAAAETSILSSKLAMPEDIDETGYLNLAEKHLAYFTTQPIDDPDDPQYGEGCYYREGMTTQDKFNMGGNFFLATSLFSSGIGPNLEARSYPEDSGKSGTMESVLGYHGKNYQTEQRKTDVKQGDQTVKEWQDYCYNYGDDWDIDHEYRYLQSFVMKESSCLPSPAKITKNKKGVKQYEYNPEATKAFKKELMEGRAISVAFKADASQPNQKTDGKYISKNWAHYTYEIADITHGVTIVGWNDDYPKENFVEGHQPPANGAWLVKNSWGSGEESFPNKGPGTWGIPNAKGEGTGYFWLSYYDQTISVPETFEFDRSNVNSSYYLEQHDKMPVESMAGAEATGPVKMANMFTAEETLDLEQVSCQTTVPGTQVTYNIYLLPKNADGPDDGVLSATVGPKTYEFGGFHKENLTAPLRIQKGQKYSVEVIQQKNGKYYFNMQEGVSENYAKKHNWAGWSKAVVNKGESFLYVDGNYRDFSDKKLQKTLLGEDAGAVVVDNFPIKAYFREAAIDTVFNIYGNEGTSMDKDAEPDYVYVRLAGKSKLASYPTIRWACSDPNIVSIKLVGDNDSNADLVGLNSGIAYVTASMDGVGTVVVKETVLPPKSSVTKITTGKKNSKKLKVKVAAAAKEYIDGYQVAYCVKGAKKIKIKEIAPNRTAATLTKLKKGKKYEVTVRTYKVVGDKALFSEWSDVKTSPKVK